MLSHFSRVRLCATLSLGFSRQEHWSGLPFSSPMQKSEKWKWRRLVLSDSSRPHGLQPTRLLRPWDFPGKNTGVRCHCLLNTKYTILFLLGVFLEQMASCFWMMKLKEWEKPLRLGGQRAHWKLGLALQGFHPVSFPSFNLFYIIYTWIRSWFFICLRFLAQEWSNDIGCSKYLITLVTVMV